jgi:hypothetical protein
LGEYRPAKSSKFRLRRSLLGRNEAAIEQPMPRKDQPFTCACHAIDLRRIAREGTPMKNKWIIAGLIAVLMLLGAAKAAAQSYNPIRWIKKGPTASEQLAANGDQTKKLATELQAILPPKTKLEDACTAFRLLNECVASLHVSHNLKIKFNCLKWDVTGIQPGKSNVSSCSAPEGGKALSLAKAIQTLKPEADAKAEAKSAERRAQEDIKDASS